MVQELYTFKKKGGKNLKYFIMVMPMFMIIGLYFIVLGIWELRKGTDRENYILYMILGIALSILLPWVIWFLTTTTLLLQ